MKTTKPFLSSGDRVITKKSGDGVLSVPAPKSWDALIRSLEMFSADFMDDRQQPPKQRRRQMSP